MLLIILFEINFIYKITLKIFLKILLLPESFNQTIKKNIIVIKIDPTTKSISQKLFSKKGKSKITKIPIPNQYININKNTYLQGYTDFLIKKINKKIK